MIYVMTAVHNRFFITKRFIGRLRAQTCQDFRLLLVDDGSTDHTDEMVKQALPDAILLYGDGNLWWGGAMHRAYQYLKAHTEIPDTDTLLIGNDDSIIPDDFLEKGLRLLDAQPEALITGCGFGLHSGTQLDGAVRYDFAHSQDTVLLGTAEGNCASTRALFLRIGTLRQVGGFHPILLPHYLSDYEYTIRAFRKGHPIRAFEALRYEYDEGTTGLNANSHLSLRQLFSKRCMANPLHRLRFIRLVSPPRALFPALWAQLKRYRNKAAR